MLPTPFLGPLASTVDGHNLQQPPSLAELKKGRVVGRGGQGGMYRYRPAKTQQQLVVKILELLDDKDDEAERAIREVVISPMLDHVGVNFLSCFADSLTRRPGVSNQST